ncbi:retrovirus-related pol polyprotein from transposon TNT 1-94 [Tanacetum coccineum]
MGESYTTIHQKEENGRMMLDSIDNGLLVYPTVKENRQTRPKKYFELTEAQQLQDDCDIQATIIILHGLLPDVYALVNHQEAANDIWDKGETLYEYYWRFSQLINDMHTIGMTMQQVQVNTKFLNALLHEWSKFITDVKLAKSLYTKNYDQLFPPSNNQLRTSLNPRNQATIQDCRITVQQVQGRQTQSFAGIRNKGIPTTSRGNFAAGQPRNSAFQTEYLDAYDSDCDDISSAKAVLMANLSSCDPDVLSKIRAFKPSAILFHGGWGEKGKKKWFKQYIKPISHRLKNNRDAHEVYLEKTIENTDTLRRLVKCARKQNPSEPLLEFACMFTKHIQELLVYVSTTCPSLTEPYEKLVAVTPMNKDKKVRFAEPVTSSNNIPKQTDSLKTKDFNKPLLTSIGVKSTTSASGSKPSGNTKNNRITRPPSINQKNKVKEHSRKVKSSLNKMNSISEPISNAHVKHFVRNAKFESICAICNKCLFDANHDMCVIDYVNDVNAEAVATACYTQNRSLIQKRHNKIPYELLHDRKADLSYLHVFGALCYPTIDGEDLGKLKPKADIGIFIGYSPVKKAFRIYNKRTRMIIESIHVDFDELTTMASKQFSSGPGPKFMTPRTISLGLVQNIPSSTPYVPPMKNDWEILFQLMFDEYLNPPPCVDLQVPAVITPEPAVSTGTPSLTTIDQDAPSSSTSQTNQETPSLVISLD